ncbi:UDP-3-O-(3-hydroxymyristoyl)glucosamine N-acyltransferase [Candidatus Poribacteria bacterium]|nr:UDP-3-O-(3-hydroxymyristoyl)glucosamine N-acyltransferase [Candidatus Poribacteria bacterium]
MSIKLKDICKHLGGDLSGDGEIEITGVSGIKDAEPNQITFVANTKYLSAIATTQASAIIIGRGVSGNGIATICVDNPYWGFVKALELFAWNADTKPQTGIHESVIIGENVSFGEGVTIEPFSVIADNVEIGDETIIKPHVYIGPDTKIGKNGLIYSQVSIRENVTIGDNVIIHCGAVIGSDGFGFTPDPSNNSPYKIPQIGTVVIEDNVEIGANTTIDRATIAETLIKSGTKLDNLVQIAHNVVIGKDCCLAAQSGMAGSSTLGDRVNIAGQSGVVGHLSVGENSVLFAKSAITKDTPPNSQLSGFPARPHKQELRFQAANRKLPELMRGFKQLQEKVVELEEKLKAIEHTEN